MCYLIKCSISFNHVSLEIHFRIKTIMSKRVHNQSEILNVQSVILVAVVIQFSPTHNCPVTLTRYYRPEKAVYFTACLCLSVKETLILVLRQRKGLAK